MNNGISFEDYLARHDALTYTNVGVSMQPLLREGKDLFIVRKKGAERCRKGDVVLYKRASESYVLHRIIEVHPTEYVILGDNCILKEYGIRDKDDCNFCGNDHVCVRTRGSATKTDYEQLNDVPVHRSVFRHAHIQHEDQYYGNVSHD